MNDVWFDHLTKELARGWSRRGVLKALGAMAAAGTVALVNRRQAAAQPIPPCQRVGEICRVDVHCCTGTCTDFRCACPPERPNFCAATQQCLAPCPEGKIFNAETCVCECPLVVCPEGTTFNAEICVCECLPNTRQCPGGQCCATAGQCCGTGCCPEGTICCRGECVVCPPGTQCPGARCTSNEQCCSGVCSAFTGTCL